MKQKINTIQKFAKSSRHMQDDQYILNSLTNLGQRFSMKGDGVQVSGFGLYELFGGLQGAHNIGRYVKAEVSENRIALNAYSKEGDLLDTKILSGHPFIHTADTINGGGHGSYYVDHYASGAVILKGPNTWSYTINGLNSMGMIEDIIVESVVTDSSNNNQLVYGVRFYENIDKDKNKYIEMMYIHMKDDSRPADKNYIVETYPLSTNVFEDLVDVAKMFYDVNSDIIYGNEEKLADASYLVKKFKDRIYIKDIPSTLTEYKYNNNTHVFDHISGTIITGKPRADVLNYFSYDIKELVSKIAEYYNTNVYFDKNDNLAFKEQLVIAIMNKLFTDFKEKSIYDDVPFTYFYLPYEYEFVYTCNSNNPAIIYNSAYDVTVEYTVEPKNELSKITSKVPEQLIICDSNDTFNIEDKFIAYSYQVTYGEDGIVADISVFKKYVLPYIDNNGYWCINDVQTSIYARGKSGGQPSIIMTYTDMSATNSELQKMVLSSFKRDEITNLNWAKTEYKIRALNDSNNIANTDYHMMTTFMPTDITGLNENLISLLESAIIMNINSVRSENRLNAEGKKPEWMETDNLSTAKASLAERLSNDAVIPTFWVMQRKKKEDAPGTSHEDFEYVFECVLQPENGCAVDMNYLSNAESIVKNYIDMSIEPDIYQHRWLVFKSQSIEYKNTTNDIPTKPLSPNCMASPANRNWLQPLKADEMNYSKVWPLIRNMNSENLHERYESFQDGPESNYINNMNLMPAFSNNIRTSNINGTITGIDSHIGHKFFRLYSVGNKKVIPAFARYKNVRNELVPNAFVGEISAERQRSFVPTINLSEVFLQDVTAFNRINIISPDDVGNGLATMRYAYIGTVAEEADKSKFVIGTGEFNPNIGTDTLMDEAETKNFTPHTELAIQFDKISFSGTVDFDQGFWTENGETPVVSSAVIPAIATTKMQKISDVKYMSANLLGYTETVDHLGRTIKTPYINIDKLLERAKAPGYEANKPYTVMRNANKLSEIAGSDGKKCNVMRLDMNIDDEMNQLRDATMSDVKIYITNPFAISCFSSNIGMMVYNIRELCSSNNSIISTNGFI